eukprot:TRINITY_DN66704_c0_g1_i1.p1 TRINITY_DN66704_c0_g1~~TRINITY_DN66704_c0_g1_i1.p1  ORF type:complete len:198 (+),score=1.63 TRINITY_DN66704_c0_g1_i1:567-1160(+)
MAYGLWSLHRSGVLHGDLKFENVLFVTAKREDLVLIDFGFSTYPCSGACDSGTAGTQCYFAPSIWQGKSHGSEVDWWALGVLLYSMAIRGGCLSPKGRENIEHAVANGYGIKLSPEIDADLRDLLQTLLNKEQIGDMDETTRGLLIKSDPTQHPYLRHKFWRKFANDPSFARMSEPDQIDAYWKKICTDHSAYEGKC